MNAFLDASRREKHDGIQIIVMAFFVLKLFTKNHTGKPTGVVIVGH